MSFTERSLEASGSYDRIVGEVQGKYYTLQHAFTTKQLGLFTEHSLETIFVNRIYVGALYGESDAIAGDGFAVEMEWLTQFASQSGVQSEISHHEADGSVSFSITGKAIEKETVQLVDGGSISLVNAVGWKESPTEAVISQGFHLDVSYRSTMPAEDLVDVASDLQDLASMGTGRHCVFTDLSLVHPDVTRNVGGKLQRLPIQVLARWNAYTAGSAKPLNYHDMFFSLKDLGGMSAVARWLDVTTRQRETLGRVMATRYANGMYVSDRYLSRIAALEGFNRIEAGDGNKTVSLNRRLKRCVDLAGDPLKNLVGDPDKWIEIVKKDRDDIAHHYGRRRREESAEQHHLAESAYWLYTLCLLRLIDAPQAVFDRIVAHQQFGYLRRQLANILSR